MDMRKLIFAVVTPAVMLMSGGVALAASAHFLYASGSVDNSGSLSVSFKEAGLGNGATTAGITLSADASALYQCFNNGGKHPQAGNKETVTAPVSNTGTFDVRNGSTSGTITVAAPGPGSFSCPGGQTLHLISATYANVTLTDTSTTPADVANIPGTFTSGILYP
jgi:hypothetical protein